MSSRRLQKLSSRRLQGMSSRRFQDVFSVTIFRDVLREVLKTSSRRLRKMSSKTSLQHVFARHLQDVLEDVKFLCRRRVEDIFKMSSRPTNVCWVPSKQNYLLSKSFTFDNSNSHCLEQIRVIALSFFGFELSRVNCSCSHFFH